jgi:hypothetical protein
MKLHSCSCSACQAAGSNATKEVHTLMNFFLAQLDEKQQKLYVGLEAKKRGPGSEHGLSLILGWDEQAIAVARREAEIRAGLDDGEKGIGSQSGESVLEQANTAKLARAAQLPPRENSRERWFGSQLYSKG